MKDETRSFYDAAVRRAVARIANGLDEALDLAALAREAALSPLHFHRVFRGMIGETPLELHRRLRLERAARELTAGDRPVTAVAFDAGYETHESFTRAFRSAYAASPTEARARRLPFRLAARCGVHVDGGELVTLGAVIMDVKIDEVPEMHVACVRHIGPYNTIGAAFGTLGQLAGHLFARPGANMIAIYHDAPDAVPPAELRSDAGVSVAPGTPLPPELAVQRIPAGRYAITTHVGPYDKLGDTWAQLMGGWIPQHGHQLTGASFELYRVADMSRPDELRTDVCVGIR